MTTTTAMITRSGSKQGSQRWKALRAATVKNIAQDGEVGADAPAQRPCQPCPCNKCYFCGGKGEHPLEMEPCFGGLIMRPKRVAIDIYGSKSKKQFGSDLEASLAPKSEAVVATDPLRAEERRRANVMFGATLFGVLAAVKFRNKAASQNTAVERIRNALHLGTKDGNFQCSTCMKNRRKDAYYNQIDSVFLGSKRKGFLSSLFQG